AERLAAGLLVALAAERGGLRVLELAVQAGLEQPARVLRAALLEILVAAAALDVAQELTHAPIAADVVPLEGLHGHVEVGEVVGLQPASELLALQLVRRQELLDVLDRGAEHGALDRREGRHAGGFPSTFRSVSGGSALKSLASCAPAELPVREPATPPAG